jgi:hypothetical protein
MVYTTIIITSKLVMMQMQMQLILLAALKNYKFIGSMKLSSSAV